MTSQSETVRLTTSQALVRYLAAQQIDVDGNLRSLFRGAFGIFGHGNVTSLGEAFATETPTLPVIRGQNEQSMALAAVAFAKASRRSQIMVATSSIGPGATNMITASALAHVNRIPVLLLAGDAFASRLAHPVLQQLEFFDSPTTNANDAFRAVTRFWDRITRPEQIMQSLPQATAMMLDPATTGPAFIGLSQDVQAEAYPFPVEFFEHRVHSIPRPRPDHHELLRAVSQISEARRPLIIAGGGVKYSRAEEDLAAFAERFGIPVAETVAGRTSLEWNHPANVGPIGVIGSTSANMAAASADLVIALGTRLQDFTTGSWTIFRDPEVKVIGVNVTRHDAIKHGSTPLVGDAKVTLELLTAELADWHAPKEWLTRNLDEYAQWSADIDSFVSRSSENGLSYGQVIRAVNDAADDTDLILTAAGGFPGELNKVWRARSAGSLDCEFGYSCMGYEIAGGLGAKIADPQREVIVLVGDGSYLLMNSELYSSVNLGHKLIIVLCDNSGFAVIDRLQREKGSPAYNNMFSAIDDAEPVSVDFAAHAQSMGATAEVVKTADELINAVHRAKTYDRTHVVVIRTDPDTWAPGGAWWDVGVPEVSELESVQTAKRSHEESRGWQRTWIPS